MSGQTFVFAGGGTGGHVFPGLAIAEQLQEQAGDQARAVFACSTRPLDAEILRAEGAQFEPIPAQPFGLWPPTLWRFLGSWGGAVRSGRTLLRNLKKDSRVHVVAMGGFVAAPMVQAARAEKCRVTMVNLDARPGRANRWIARRAECVFTSAEVSYRHWQAIRPIVRKAARPPGNFAACRRTLGLEYGRATLLVTGASQGAQSINRMMVYLVRYNPAVFLTDRWQVIHQTGKADTDEVRAAYKDAGIPAVVEPFFREMGVLWGAADLAVSRAGAGSVGEAWASAVPTIFLPYPYHRDQHQRANAAVLARAEACVIATDLVDPKKNAGATGEILITLMREREKRDAMRRNLEAMGNADGADQVARALLTGK